MTTVRDPAVAGQFYAADTDTLRDQIQSCFEDPIGPGSMPDVREKSPSIEGLVAPHAGLPYSGPVAAHAYGSLATSGQPGTVVIIGPNHTGAGASVALPASERWRTPLGELPIAMDIRDQLEAETVAEIDERAHVREHAAEVQLPFLQRLFDEVSILPISLRRQGVETARQLGTALASAAEDVTIVASSDFTHYERHEVALERDEHAIERIRADDPDGLVSTVENEGLSVCGYGAIATMLHAVDGEVSVLAHATSGDTAGSKDDVVSYAAIAVGN